MCSQKCASPGVGLGSCAAPTLTLSAAAAFSVLGSDTTIARSRLGSLGLCFVYVFVYVDEGVGRSIDGGHGPKNMTQAKRRTG